MLGLNLEGFNFDLVVDSLTEVNFDRISKL